MIRSAVHPLAGLWAARRATTGHLVDVSSPTRFWLKAVSFHRGVLKPLVARTEGATDVRRGVEITILGHPFSDP